MRPMKFVRPGTTIRFMEQRILAYMASALLIVVSVVAFAVQGLNFGIDFTGGTLVEIGYPQNVELDQVRGDLAAAGYDDAVVQHFGTATDVLIRIAPQPGVTQSELSTRVTDALRARADGQLDLRRVEFVGPQVGEELAEQGGLALLVALFGILIYVTLRFEYRFSVGAVIALAHDVIVTLGFFSVLYLPFDLTILAALLAVIGYSLNDTIVIFDRVRENFRRVRKGTPEDVINLSVNQTMSRTLLTSGTTLLVLFALLFLGGEVVRGFALALIVGIVVGTYSTIYVATAAALALGVSRADLMPVKKEGAEVDSRP